MTEYEKALAYFGLQHSGVKGMKWGVRKERPSGMEIQNARRSVGRRAREIRKIQKTDPEKATLLKNKLRTNEDRVTASRLSRGEKALLAFFGGPIGLAVIAVGAGTTKYREHDVDKARKAYNA